MGLGTRGTSRTEALGSSLGRGSFGADNGLFERVRAGGTSATGVVDGVLALPHAHLHQGHPCDQTMTMHAGLRYTGGGGVRHEVKRGVSVSAGTKGERRSTSSKQWVVEQLQPAVSLRTGRTSGAGVVDGVLALTHTGVGAIPVCDNNQPQMELHESVWGVCWGGGGGLRGKGAPDRETERGGKGQYGREPSWVSEPVQCSAGEL